MKPCAHKAKGETEGNSSWLLFHSDKEKKHLYNGITFPPHFYSLSITLSGAGVRFDKERKKVEAKGRTARLRYQTVKILMYSILLF